MRALTPSEAAERVVPDRMQVLAGLEERANRMRGLLLRRLQLAQTRLQELAGRRVLRAPVERVQEQARTLDEWEERLRRAMQRRLETFRQRLEGLIGKLESMNPLNVLARGYTLSGRLEPADEGSTLLRSTDDVQPGDRIWLRLHRGRLICQVEQVEPDQAGSTNGVDPS